MAANLSKLLTDEMLQGLTPKPWASVSLHTGEPPRDPSWAAATPVRFRSVRTREGDGVLLDPGVMYELVTDGSVPPGVAELWSGSRLLGTVPVRAFGEPGDILGRIDAALEDWERGEDAARWRPEG